MNSAITIRRAVVADAPILAELGRTTFYNTFNGTCTIDDMKGVLEYYYNLPQVESELRNEADYFHIAFIDEKAVGYSRMKEDAEPPFEALNDFKTIELKRLYVVQEQHGKGIAQALMNNCFSIARQLEKNKMYLSVWEYNIRAQEFYKKMGFINTHIENDFPLGTTPQTDFWFWRTI